jgi:chemotaxis protein methyltransferase WspC
MTDTRFADLLERVMGLHAATIGTAAVERAVAERMRAAALVDGGAYWAHLHAVPSEMQALIEAVVVPETWFFREGAAFAATVEAVMRRAAAEPLRIIRLLSLPCSSGEEPYTIAMALLDAGLPAGRFRVDAIDISLRALDLARRGLYGRNAFRSADLSFRERHFTPQGRDWRLNDAVRGPVHLAQGNVIDPGFLAGAEPYDVIFCRNLLIYFDPATQQRVAGVLARLLREDGLFFAGHSEAGVLSAHGFASAQIPMAFAFHHPLQAACSQKSRPSAPAKAPPKPLPPRPTPSLRAALPSRPTVRASAPVDPWQLVNAGRLDEARVACQDRLRADGPDAQVYLLLALISDAQGDGIGAAACYRKVLYLDPNHAEALDHLALLMRRQGDEAGARRLAERLRRQSEATR